MTHPEPPRGKGSRAKIWISRQQSPWPSPGWRGCDDFAPEIVQQVKGPEGCLLCVFPCGWLASLILLLWGQLWYPPWILLPCPSVLPVGIDLDIHPSFIRRACAECQLHAAPLQP